MQCCHSLYHTQGEPPEYCRSLDVLDDASRQGLGVSRCREKVDGVEVVERGVEADDTQRGPHQPEHGPSSAGQQEEGDRADPHGRVLLAKADLVTADKQLPLALQQSRRTA